ncbi:MAG: glycosyltransferase [bacterium]|nr:glycosyltransferase [bacterium]
MRLGLYVSRHAGGRGGMATYSYALAEYLAGCAGSETELELVVYGDQEFFTHCPELVSSWHHLVIDSPSSDRPVSYRILPDYFGRRVGYLFDQLVLPYWLRRDNVDVVYGSANFTSIFSRLPKVVTIHDLFQGWPPVASRGSSASHLNSMCHEDSLSDSASRAGVAGTTLLSFRKALKKVFQYCYRLAFRWQARRAKVIADSPDAAKEIAERLGCRDVSTIPLGLDRVFSRYFEREESRQALFQGMKDWRERRGVPVGSVLVLASSDPRKNLSGIIATLKAKLPDAVTVVALDEKAAEKVRRSVPIFVEDQENYRLIKPLPREEVPFLFASARVLLLPTLAEGFGLPVVEALAAGTSVVAGDFPHLRDAVTLKGDKLSQRWFSCAAQNSDDIGRALSLALRATEPLMDETDYEFLKNKGAFCYPVRSMNEAAAAVLEICRTTACLDGVRRGASRGAR